MKKLALEIFLVLVAFSAVAAESLPYESVLAKGNELLEKQAYADAARLFDEAIESRRSEQNSGSLAVVHLLLPAAKAHAGLGQERRVNAYFDAAIDLLESPSSEDKTDLIAEAFSARQEIGSLSSSKTRSRQLVEIYDIASEVLGDKDLRTASMATELGLSLAYKGQQDEAVIYLDQAYSILKGASFVDPDEIGSELLSLGAANVLVDRAETADELVGIAVAIGASTEEPVPIYRAPPVYPSDCLAKGISGEVSMAIAVDNTGRVSDVRVTELHSWRGRKEREANDRSCGRGLEKAAQDAVSRFRYIPKLEQGAMVGSEGVTTTVSFVVE